MLLTYSRMQNSQNSLEKSVFGASDVDVTGASGGMVARLDMAIHLSRISLAYQKRRKRSEKQKAERETKRSGWGMGRRSAGGRRSAMGRWGQGEGPNPNLLTGMDQRRLRGRLPLSGLWLKNGSS